MNSTQEVQFILNGGNPKDLSKVGRLLRNYPDIKLGKKVSHYQTEPY